MHVRSRLVSLVCSITMLSTMTPAAVQPSVAVGAPYVSVKIAVAAPLSAGATVLGQGMVRGAQLAVSDYSAQLLSAGVSVSVVATDDQGDPSAATAVANTIVTDSSILGVVGHLNSGCSIPAAQIYQPARLAMVTPISTNPELTQMGLDNVFRTCATDAGQGPFGADVAVKNLRLTRAYVVDDSTPYGEGLSSSFIKQFRKDGGKVIGRAKTSDRDYDFSALVKKIKAVKPTVIYYGGIYNAGSLLARRLRAKGVKAQFMGGDGIYDSTFVSLAGRKAAEGAVATSVGLPSDQLPGGAAYLSHFATNFPGESSIGADDPYAYDATVAIIKGILRVVGDAGSTSALESPGARGLVRAKIAASNFSSVTGAIKFTARGDRVIQQFSVYRVSGGRWRETATIGAPRVWYGKAGSKRWVDVACDVSPALPTGDHTVKVVFAKKSGSKYRVVKTVTARMWPQDARPWVSVVEAHATLSKGTYRIYVRQSGDGMAPMDGRYITKKLK